MMLLKSAISYVLGLIGIGLAIYYGIRQHNAKKVMRVFIRSIQNQCQSVCRSLQDSIKKEPASYEWLKGKLEGTYDNIAALNGTIIDFCNEFYKENDKQG